MRRVKLLASACCLLAILSPGLEASERTKIGSIATARMGNGGDLEPDRPILDWELQMLVASRLGTDHDMIFIFAHLNGARLTSHFDNSQSGKYDRYPFPNATAIGLGNDESLGTDILWSRHLRFGLPLADAIDLTHLHLGNDFLVGRTNLDGKLVGGDSSTHVLIWAPFPRYDTIEINNIMLEFSGRENVTVHLAAGDGQRLVVSGDNVYVPDYPATATGLNSALIDISAFMAPGEQFIFYSTGPGTALEAEDLPVKSLLDPGESRSLSFLLSAEQLRAWQNWGVEGLGLVGFETSFDGIFRAVNITVAGQDVDTSVEPHVYLSADLSMELFELPLSILEGLTPDGAGQLTVDVELTNASDSPLELSALLFGSADVSAPTGPVRTLAAAARAEGAGAFFLSRWNLFNRGEQELSLEMVFTPRGGGAADSTAITLDLSPGTLMETEDVLAEVFGITDDTIGSVLVDVVDGPAPDFQMQSVISARQLDGSEFNQFFEAIPFDSRLTPGTIGTLHSTEAPDRNRVNVGACALEDNTVLRVWPEKPIGTALAASRQMSLDRGGTEQLNNIDTVFGLSGEVDVVLRMEVLSGSAVGYVSVLDGVGGTYIGTSDPTTVLPVITGASMITLLEVGPIQGLNEFSGSGSVTNYGQAPVTVVAEFYRRDQPGVETSETLQLAAGETVGFADVVAALFGLENAIGTVVLRAPEGSFIGATGREFAVFRDELGRIVGTAGQPMPGLTSEDLLSADWAHHFIGLRHSGEGERSHLAFFNPNDTALTYTVELFDVVGASEGTLTGSVDGNTLVQINNIIPRINSQHDDVVKRIEVTLSQSAHLLAFRVNPSGDPITITPF